MLGSKKIIAFVAARDPARAKAFYGETLGLRLVNEDPYAVVFDAGGTMLRVAMVPKVVAAPYTVLGWQVSDILATTQALAAAGVKPERYAGLVQDDRGVWTAPSGAKIVWFKDPEGNVLSVSQF